MTLYGLDPEENEINDPATLRELIYILKEMVGNLQGMDKAQRKMLELSERIMKEQEDKICTMLERADLQQQLIDTQRDTIEQYQIAFSSEHFNDVRRLN
jgi:Na+/phosphate symporter